MTHHTTIVKDVCILCPFNWLIFSDITGYEKCRQSFCNLSWFEKCVSKLASCVFGLSARLELADISQCQKMSGLCVREGRGEDPNAGLWDWIATENHSFIADDEQNMNWTTNAETGNTQAQSEGTTRRWTLQDTHNKYTGRKMRERGTGGTQPGEIRLNETEEAKLETLT